MHGAPLDLVAAGQRADGHPCLLYERDGQSQAELARVVAIEQPTMVRTIDRMVRDGLVTREADPTDRLVTRIRLTDKARALEDALYAASIDANRGVALQGGAPLRRGSRSSLMAASHPGAPRPS